MADVRGETAASDDGGAVAARRHFVGFALLAPLAWAARATTTPPASRTAAAEPVPDGRPHRFGFAGGHFTLDGKPWQIRSGEMHPARIPREHWLHRIRMAKAMGLNTIALYLMWNDLEREPGVFDLDGERRDFAAFIRLCQQEGLWVYLRPGPYVCAEWDLGGLPPYLLRHEGVRLRDGHDPVYMAAVRRYVDAVAPRIVPLMAAAGGPVLMLQVENEYSMFGADVGYLETLRALWQAHGIDGPFAVADGLDDLKRRRAYLPGAALGLDGADLPQLREGAPFARGAPTWVSESYPGWLTHWGEPRFAGKDDRATLEHLMRHGVSFNLYVVHGGTNFGLAAGANADDDGSHFQPVITSYDYGAPIDERGDATPAYRDFRAIITRHTRRRPPAMPAATPAAHFDEVQALPYASLWDNLPGPAHQVERPIGNERLLGQNQGLVVYRRPLAQGGTLHLGEVRDYAAVQLDGRTVGHVSRMHHPALHNSPEIALPPGDGRPRMLEVLVDSFGHINFGPALGDAKGLLGEVHLDGQTLRGWTVHGLPLDDATADALRPLAHATEREGLFFRARPKVIREGDAYLDMSAWNKGYVWVNGHLLGRYWQVGPQQRLYCPRGWLKPGANEVTILDLHRTAPAPLRCAATLTGNAA